MRLIDADGLIEGRVSNDPVVIAAKCATTIDAVPVVHGRWVKRNDGPYGQSRLYCSACGEHSALLKKRPYCPNCGAKMDGEVSE